MAAKKLTSTGFAELMKRVPANQVKQFEEFQNITMEYQRRVNKYPEKLPKIDWQYYRNNVRKDFVKMVDKFQIKYEELNKFFASRNGVLDFSKYYNELNELTAETQMDVKNYIEESNSRIRIYENEIRRIKSLVPYENMTLEQFVLERKDIAQFIPGQGKPLFWPHEPSEQRIGPADPSYDPEYQKEKLNETKTQLKDEEVTEEMGKK